MKANEVNLGQSSEGDTVPVNLHNPDGSLHRSIRIAPQFATRIINFIGKRYERVETEENAWIETGLHPESALSGAPD